MSEIFEAFDNCRRYKGKTLEQHVENTLHRSEVYFEIYTQDFLKIVTTWVFRKLSGRGRKGGIPLGQLKNFVFPEGYKFNFMEALEMHLMSIWRKRGLMEYDRQKASVSFEQMVDAFDKVYRRK